MKSKAHIKSHPLHPILIPFPIALFSSVLVFDCLTQFIRFTEFKEVTSYIHAAGIFSAILAAVPGVIDYFYTVPPDSSAKKRATKHGAINGLMLIIFIIAFLWRDTISLVYLIALELIAFTLMLFAGWMGGTLVHRNLIGVDMRYANAGKWKEQNFGNKKGLLAVAASDELKTDQMKLLHVGGKRIVLAKTELTYVAFDDRCTHRGGSLAGGIMICGTVQCPWHGSQFDVYDGEVKAGPAEERINTYTVLENGGKVYLDLSKTN